MMLEPDFIAARQIHQQHVSHELAQDLVRSLHENVEEPKDRHLTVHK